MVTSGFTVFVLVINQLKGRKYLFWLACSWLSPSICIQSQNPAVLMMLFAFRVFFFLSYSFQELPSQIHPRVCVAHECPGFLSSNQNDRKHCHITWWGRDRKEQGGLELRPTLQRHTSIFSSAPLPLR